VDVRLSDLQRVRILLIIKKKPNYVLGSSAIRERVDVEQRQERRPNIVQEIARIEMLGGDTKINNRDHRIGFNN